MKPTFGKKLLALVATSAVGLTFATGAMAHCDAMDGPVISEARSALTAENVTPLLKWVPAADEEQVTTVFDKAVEVRKLGDDAQHFADRQLFTTLVEVHRASEGASFTGIKPAGQIDPAVMAADKALVSGRIDDLLARISSKFEQTARAHFEATLAAKEQSEDSVQDGRDYVEHYVQYVHYLENAHNAIVGNSTSHDH